MTSSFSNLVGTERDRIPDMPVSNYASTEANMEGAVNKQIDKNIADQEEFFNSIAEIEELKAKNFNDRLSALGSLVKNVAQFAEVRERNREARESLKFATDLYADKQAQFLEFQEKKLDMNEAEQEAALREIAGESEEVYDFLKTQFAPTITGLDAEDFVRRYDDHAASALNNRIQAKNVLFSPTREGASAAIDDTIENIVTKYLMDASAKGLNPQSRKLRRHFIKQLYPALIKEKERILSRWERVSEQQYLNANTAFVDSAIVDTVNSQGVVQLPDGTSITDYNGVYDDDETGLIQLVQFKRGLSKKQALDYIIERMGSDSLRGKLQSGGVAYFMNKAKFTNKATGKVLEGYANAGIGNQGEIDGNMNYLTRVRGEIAQANSKLYKTLVTGSQERVRELRLQNLSDAEFTMALAEEEVKFRAELKAKGLEEDLPLPSHLLTDETSGVGNETYSNQVGKANKIFDIINVERDYVNGLRSEKRDPNLELTSLQKNIQVKAAEYELTQKVNERMAGDQNLTLEAALQLEYPTVLQKLLSGGYSAQVDITRPTLAVDIRNDQTFLKDNGIDSTMNQKEFVSIDEKRALDQLYDYYESGFKTPFPQYFRSVTHGTNVMPHEYALARYKAMYPGDTSNMKNPETFFDLTEEEQRFLYLRKNQTKNLQLLNDDDDTTIETKMLKSFEVRENPDLYSKPTDTPGLKKFFESRNLTQLSIADAYRLAKQGYSNFGLYGFSSEELIEVVEAGGLDVRDTMDEQTQKAMVFGLMRIQANKSNSIMGALIDADKDWRRLTNLSDAEKTQVLQFFPNLRGMPNNQFQSLQGDINEIIIESIQTKRGTKEQFFNRLIEEYVENDFGGITI